MKKLVVISLVFCLLLSFCGVFVHATTADTIQTAEKNEEVIQTEEASGIDSAVALLGGQKLIDNAKAVFLYELSSDTLMYTQNPDDQMHPSSFVKILTALIAIEKGNLNDLVTATDDVLSTVSYDAVSADLQDGEQMTLEHLIYCMMVGSANDAAAVIANHISGSQEAFVQEMNDYAQNLGCTNTLLKNVHGLHHDEQYTTVRDMARILRAAMKNEIFSTVFSTVRFSVPATNKSESRDLATGNFLMNTDTLTIYFDERVTGGRTGVAVDGRRCLATSAEINGLKLISIVMGSEDIVEEDGLTTDSYGGYKETSLLLDKSADGYKAVQVLFPNQAVNQCSVIDGENDVILGSNVAISAVLPTKVGLDDLTFRYINAGELRAPITAGDQISQVEVWHGATCVAKGALYAMNSVRSVLETQPVEEINDNGAAAKSILTTIFLVAAGAVLIVIAVRFLPNLRRIHRKHRMKRYSRNRRRSH